MTLNAGFGAACPRPQIEASIMACESSLSNGWFHCFASISPRALAVPTLQGVHWPQDSSLKNFIKFFAACEALSLSERITKRLYNPNMMISMEQELKKNEMTGEDEEYFQKILEIFPWISIPCSRTGVLSALQP